VPLDTESLIVIGPLTEVTQELALVQEVDQAAVEGGDYSSVQIGSHGTYRDDLIDERGEKIGTVFGYAEAVYRRPSDGHVFSWYHEEITLPDGTAVYDGPLDTTLARQGGLTRVPIVGTGGRYEGLLGTREIKVKHAKLLNDVKFIFFPG
jgi:Allene oxide cyclase barrel like domain